MSSQKKSNSPDDLRAKAIEEQDVKFLGWQETLTGDMFPLYNVFKADNSLYRSTVTEETLRAQNLRVPKTPSPYPDVAQSPWHSLGTELIYPATAREAIIEGGLDYTVVKKPLKDVVDSSYSADLSNRWATVRTDTGDILGIVGESYEPVQNVDAFGFFDNLVGANEAIYETVGTLGRGERIWILAKLPGYIRVRGKDLVSKYLLLSNSHDGSSLMQIKLTPIRVACNNTLTAALSGEGEINIRHTVNAAVDARQALAILGLSNSLYAGLEATFNRMALKKIDDARLQAFMRAVVPDNEYDDHAKIQTIRNACLNLYESGHGAELSRGTLWGAFNSVTEYTDHAMEDNATNRLESIWTGRGERLNRKAFRLAETML